MCGPQTAVFTQMSSHFHMKPECHHPPPLPHSAAHSCPHAAPFTDLAKAFLWPRNKTKQNKSKQQTPRCWEAKMPRAVVQAQGDAAPPVLPAWNDCLQNAGMHLISPGLQQFPNFQPAPARAAGGGLAATLPRGHSLGTPPRLRQPPCASRSHPASLDFRAKPLRQLCQRVGAAGGGWRRGERSLLLCQAGRAAGGVPGAARPCLGSRINFGRGKPAATRS